MSAHGNHADELVWAGTIIDPSILADHFGGLHDGMPVLHCTRCTK